MSISSRSQAALAAPDVFALRPCQDTALVDRQLAPQPHLLDGAPGHHALVGVVVRGAHHVLGADDVICRRVVHHDIRVRALGDDALAGEHPVQLGGVLRQHAAHGRQTDLPGGHAEGIEQLAPRLHTGQAAGNGGEIVISWAEALFGTPEETGKGDRMEFAGKYFRGLCDRFFPGRGENTFFNFDYRAGRYAEIRIISGYEPLEIHDLKFYENRYPLEFAGEWRSSDPRLDALVAPAFRTLQMCAHDTLMDCPYYEQLMYIGDGRLQLLAGYVSAGEAFGALADHVMELWAEGIREDGIFMSIYPAQAYQIIPGFSLIFLLAICDYIRYRDLRKVSAQIFPLGVRSLIAWENSLDAEGLLRINRGWRFVDWVEGWPQGVPPGAETQAHCIFNALYAYVLKEFAEICRWKNEPELAARFSRRHNTLLKNIIQKFYVPEAGLFSDLAEENVFSEHANSLMLLAGIPELSMQRQTAENLFAPSKKFLLTRTSLYFSFYYLEAAAATGFMNAFFRRLDIWEAVEKLHFDTMPETSEPTRSDCHGWSAHILYHLYATIAGIRPSAPGGSCYSVRPHPGHLTAFSGRMTSIAKTMDFSWPPGIQLV